MDGHFQPRMTTQNGSEDMVNTFRDNWHHFIPCLPFEGPKVKAKNILRNANVLPSDWAMWNMPNGHL